jgi:hypothetical protein
VGGVRADGLDFVFAAGLGLAAAASGPIGLFSAWAVLGLAMGGGLYKPLSPRRALHGRDSPRADHGHHAVAGFASTVGWPLPACWKLVAEAADGRRLLGWALLHPLSSACR